MSKDTPPHKTDNDNDERQKKPEKGAPVFSLLCDIFFCFLTLFAEFAVLPHAEMTFSVTGRKAFLRHL